MNELKITKELYDEVKTLEIEPSGTFDYKVKSLLISILNVTYFPEKEAINFMDIIDNAKQRYYDISIQDRTIFVDDKIYRAIKELDVEDLNRTACLVLIKALTVQRMSASELDKINAIMITVRDELSN